MTPQIPYGVRSGVALLDCMGSLPEVMTRAQADEYRNFVPRLVQVAIELLKKCPDKEGVVNGAGKITGNQCPIGQGYNVFAGFPWDENENVSVETKETLSGCGWDGVTYDAFICWHDVEDEGLLGIQIAVQRRVRAAFLRYELSRAA